MESRLYAEDPYRNFLPSIGRLTRYRPPAERVAKDCIVRNDTGVFEGGEISMFYDPMIAKLCTWSTDRSKAICAMETALDLFEIEGIGHNLPFLSAVMGHARFKSGNITTAFIDEVNKNHQESLAKFGIEYTNYYSTHSKENEALVSEIYLDAK